MSDFSIGTEGLNPLKGFNPVKQYMNTFKNNLKDITDSQESTLPGQETLKGYLSKSQIDLNQDQELANDISALTGVQNSVSSSEMTPDSVAKSFSNVIGNYINDVNGKQKASESAVETFVSGGNIDLHSVMIASEKANLSMQLTMQMRNKILQAYQEISRMQV